MNIHGDCSRFWLVDLLHVNLSQTIGATRVGHFVFLYLLSLVDIQVDIQVT